MSGESSSYALELAHQRRMVLLLALILLAFGMGVRLDRAFITQTLRDNSPAAAFSALVPPPTLFPGAPGGVVPGMGSGATGRGNRGPDSGGGGGGGGGTPGGSEGPGGGSAFEGPTSPPTPGPTFTPTLVASVPAGNARAEFGGTGSSIFGIPSGVIFGGGSGGGTGITDPGTPPLVPEPDSWALMILGIGMIGLTMRARRSAATRADRVSDDDEAIATA